MVRRQIGKEFLNIGILFVPLKKIYQIWSLVNVNQVWKIMVHNDLFHHALFFFFFAINYLKNFTWCNAIQQIKKVSPYYFQDGNCCTFW